MEEINLDDLHDELSNSTGENQEFVDAPGIDGFDAEEEQDDINLYDLAPDIYSNPHPTDADAPSTSNATNSDPLEESDLVVDLLRSKGIQDPTAINYEGENGEIEQKNFFELPYDEQLEILRSSDADIDGGLAEHEVQTLSFLRENGVTMEEAIEYFQRKAVEDHINNQSITGLEVDQYSNEELYALHLRTEYPDLTDDEITFALEKQQEHPELFKRQVEKLRTDYKDTETKQIEDARQLTVQAEEQKRKELEDTLIDVATSIRDIGGLTLDDGDRNIVLDHILNKDLTGVSPFLKSLNSPERLFQLAWYAVKGEEAFNIIHDYYKKEISQVSKSAFEKGKQSVLGSVAPPAPSNKKSYTRKGHTQTPAARSNPSPNEGLSINDINID